MKDWIWDHCTEHSLGRFFRWLYVREEQGWVVLGDKGGICVWTPASIIRVRGLRFIDRVVTDDARLNGDFLSENWPTDAAEEFIEAVIILVW